MTLLENSYDFLNESLRAAARDAQTSPEMATLERRSRLSFARRPVRDRPTVELALLKCRAAGEWLSFGAEPAC
jgi:hypothetical protein